MRDHLFFKDLSFFRQTNRVSLSLSAWIPVVAIGLFSSIEFYK